MGNHARQQGRGSHGCGTRVPGRQNKARSPGRPSFARKEDGIGCDEGLQRESPCSTPDPNTRAGHVIKKAGVVSSQPRTRSAGISMALVKASWWTVDGFVLAQPWWFKGRAWASVAPHPTRVTSGPSMRPCILTTSPRRGPRLQLISPGCGALIPLPPQQSTPRGPSERQVRGQCHPRTAPVASFEVEDGENERWEVAWT